MQPIKGIFQLIQEWGSDSTLSINNKLLLLPYEQTSFY